MTIGSFYITSDCWSRLHAPSDMSQVNTIAKWLQECVEFSRVSFHRRLYRRTRQRRPGLALRWRWRWLQAEETHTNTYRGRQFALFWQFKFKSGKESRETQGKCLHGFGQSRVRGKKWRMLEVKWRERNRKRKLWLQEGRMGGGEGKWRRQVEWLMFFTQTCRRIDSTQRCTAEGTGKQAVRKPVIFCQPHSWLLNLQWQPAKTDQTLPAIREPVISPLLIARCPSARHFTSSFPLEPAQCLIPMANCPNVHGKKNHVEIFPHSPFIPSSYHGVSYENRFQLRRISMENIRKC